MLPPIGLADSRCGPSREEIQGPSESRLRHGSLAAAAIGVAAPPPRRSTIAKATVSTPRRSTLRPAAPSITRDCVPSSPTFIPTPLPTNALTALEQQTHIPREFFVLETNAVLPQTKYPPTQYQSTFHPNQGLWETIVFPALTPQTRQQVLYLAHTLRELQGSLNDANFIDQLAFVEREFELYSLCFHELARQIKFICKEQSELLHEIRVHYDSTLHELIVQLRSSHDESQRFSREVKTLMSEREGFIRTNKELLERIAELDGKEAASDARAGSGDSRWNSADEEDIEAFRMWQARRRRRHEHKNVGLLTKHDSSDHDDNDGSDNDSDDWASEEDSVDTRGRTGRPSLDEENIAAARVQQAYQKYVIRKEQHRLAMREEKKVAALEIQRSYRGYKDRQRFLHRRAVMKLILKRRKEAAAVELLQTNVRTYLLKKRREDSRQGRIQRESGKHDSEVNSSHTADATSAGGHNEEHSFDKNSSILQAQEAVMGFSNGVDEENDRFKQLLNRMSELAVAFSLLHSRRRRARDTTQHSERAISNSTSISDVGGDGEEHRNSEDGERDKGVAGTSDAHISTTSANAVLHPNFLEHSERREQGDNEDQHLLDETIKQAEDVVRSFRDAIVELRRSAFALGNSQISDDFELSKSTSTTTLETLPRAWYEQSGTNDSSTCVGSTFLFVEDPPMDATKAHGEYLGGLNEDQVAEVPSCENDFNDNGIHLDDVLWESGAYTPRTHEVEEELKDKRKRLVLELTTSKDQRKRHAWLKQFMTDIYDVIVGRIRELPTARRELLLSMHCRLSLSLPNWRQLRLRRGMLSTAVTSGFEPIGAFVRADISELVQEHFHCQLGLRHLVDNAIDDLGGALAAFHELDPDVQMFHEFYRNERPTEELVFVCMVRYLAMGQSGASTPRQPVFDPVTMRELMDCKRALEVAHELFAVSEEDAILEADNRLIEHHNEIYRRHLPTSGYHQLEEILRQILIRDEGDDDASATRPMAALSPTSRTVMRSSNINQFHARAYNISAARSPLVRRPPASKAVHASPRERAMHELGKTTRTATAGGQYVFFDEFVDLLRRYHAVMTHFHLFVNWTVERFESAMEYQRSQQLVPASPSSGPAEDVPLLEESAFVETLTPFSLGSTERELRNVFHNALKQRHLHRFMPIRVFTSVVLILLRNRLLSVTSYQPLQRKEPLVGKHLTSIAASRQEREEKRWLQLALLWRRQELRFEETIEGLYGVAGATPPVDPETSTDLISAATARAAEMLQWRNELYELFVHRSGSENLERAEQLLELLMDATSQSRQTSGLRIEASVTADADDDRQASPVAPDAVSQEDPACVVGSPWTTTTPTTMPPMTSSGIAEPSDLFASLDRRSSNVAMW